MWSNLAVMTPPVLDENLRIHLVCKPLHAQALVTELAVEALARSVLPGLARIDMSCIDLRAGQPTQDRSGDELRAVSYHLL